MASPEKTVQFYILAHSVDIIGFTFPASWPTITVRPELIREGAEKLRQDEEEQRRRMND